MSKPADAGETNQALPVNEQRLQEDAGPIMSRIEYARRRARKDMFWLLIAIGVFVGALVVSLLNFGTERALAGAGSCAKQCQIEYGQCVVATSDKSQCNQKRLVCLSQCQS